MPKNSGLILGILIAVMPFVGIPSSWKTPFYFLLGCAVAAVAYQREYRKKFHLVKGIRTGRTRAQVSSDSSLSPAESIEESVPPREDNPIQNP